MQIEKRPLLAALGVALDGALGLAGLRGRVGGEAVRLGRVAKLATLVVAATYCTVLRLGV